MVKPGDLIMGDRHGVIAVPLEIARDIPKAAQMVEDWERPVINYCKSKEFNLGRFEEAFYVRPTYLASQISAGRDGGCGREQRRRALSPYRALRSSLQGKTFLRRRVRFPDRPLKNGQEGQE